ncbi:MAG: gliding motility protein GldN [Chitinophagaceae bacterium]|nr:gliding motility protein GldN [Chitinophagaceae bacterium]
MKKILCNCLLFCVIIVYIPCYGQERESNGYNPNSIAPIHESQQMFKKTLWFRIDLQEKQNLPFYAYNSELPKLIIESVKSGFLVAYEANDSLNRRMTKERFLEGLKLPVLTSSTEPEDTQNGFGDKNSNESSISNEYLYKDFSIIELKEDLIFDKNRSRMYHDLISITVVLPYKVTGTFEKPLATFKYKDLEKLFREQPSKSLWFNPKNDSEKRNFADAFALRLFSATLIKYSNPKNEFIRDIYTKSPKDAIYAAQDIEYELLEFESNLWEY